MNRTTGAVLWSVTVAGLASCVGDGTPSAGTVAVRDSAGIRIVENGPLSSAVAFRVGRPLYRIGGSDEDHNFVRVGAGVLLSDGRAAVGDGGREGGGVSGSRFQRVAVRLRRGFVTAVSTAPSCSDFSFASRCSEIRSCTCFRNEKTSVCNADIRELL